MSAQHFADVELDTDGDPWVVHFVCTGGAEDICRQWCVSCEESCTGTPVLTPAEVELIGQAPTDQHQWAPYTVSGSTSCRIVDWLEAVGWQDSGWVDEPDNGGEREVTAADLRSGRHLIEEEWTGEDYIWRYPAGPAVTDAGVPA